MLTILRSAGKCRCHGGIQWIEKEQMQADMEEFAFDNQIDFKIRYRSGFGIYIQWKCMEDNIRERLMAYPLGLLK